jgi:hypothetical protein
MLFKNVVKTTDVPVVGRFGILQKSLLKQQLVYPKTDFLLNNKKTIDDTKQGANSLGLQVRSVVARVNFTHKETRGLYRTLR